jgi:methanogenic corrinoid protein MtbC1
MAISPNKKIILELTQALIDLDQDQVKNIFTSLFQGLTGFQSANEDILIDCQKKIGLLWEKGDLALSQVYMAGKICDDLISEMLPANTVHNSQKGPIYAVVFEDFHVLGEKMLLSILRIAGFSVIDYGYGVSLNKLVQHIQEDQCEILMISTLMLNSALRIKQLKAKLDELQINVKIIVGGAPFNIDPKLWKQVGADATATTASQSIEIVKKLMEEK